MPPENNYSDPVAGRIGEQHDAYRRGLVLGLTMAEAALLIIFVLLLLIAFEAQRHFGIQRVFEGKEPVESHVLQELQDDSQLFQQIAESLGLDAEAPKDDFRELVDSIQPILRSPGGKEVLAEAQRSIDERNRVTERLREISSQLDGLDRDTVADRLETQEERIEAQGEKIRNLDGLLSRYEKEWAEMGVQKGARPCWVREDGTIDYLYEVILGSAGIRMREYPDPYRARERSRLPMPDVDPQQQLTEREFLRLTEPLYQSSLAENCRFFVVIYDDVENNDKDLYKRLRNTVEGHFYINRNRQDEPPPF